MKTSITGALFLLFLGIHFMSAQTWTLTGAPTNGWVSVACSADGSIVAAAAGQITVNGTTYNTNGPIYISTNYGTTWAQANLPITNWTKVLLSADGSKLFATSLGAGTFISTNSGVSFSTNTTLNFNYLTCSADGNKIYGAYKNPAIYASTNSGSTWMSQSFLAPSALVESPDGGKLFATVGYIYVVTNPLAGNLNWTREINSPFFLPWSSVAVSVDGTKIVGVVSATTSPSNGYGLYTSTNSGSTWITNALFGVWDSVASSADGSRLVATVGGLFDHSPIAIFLSTNSGITWTTNFTPIQAFSTFWSSAASSADGGTLYAALYSGGIWMSRSAIAPQLNVASPNNTVALSWVVPSTNLVLQQSSDLMNWTVLTNVPCLVAPNLQDRIALSPTNVSSFFRLISQ